MRELQSRLGPMPASDDVASRPAECLRVSTHPFAAALCYTSQIAARCRRKSARFLLTLHCSVEVRSEETSEHAPPVTDLSESRTLSRYRCAKCLVRARESTTSHVCCKQDSRRAFVVQREAFNRWQGIKVTELTDCILD